MNNAKDTGHSQGTEQQTKAQAQGQGIRPRQEAKAKALDQGIKQQAKTQAQDTSTGQGTGQGIKQEVLKEPSLEAYSKLSRRHKAFISAYLKHMFNGTRAYMEVHPRCKYDSARALASELLAKVSIQSALIEYIEHIEFFENLSGEKLQALAYDLYKEVKQEGSKVRLMELFYKAKGLSKDREQSTHVAIFQDVTKHLPKIQRP